MRVEKGYMQKDERASWLLMTLINMIVVQSHFHEALVQGGSNRCALYLVLSVGRGIAKPP
jgi:predicted nucleotidyltransferase component of viral defense system